MRGMGRPIVGLFQSSIIVFTLLLAPASVFGKTLVFCSEGDPGTLNPQVASTKTGMNAGRPIFNNLVEYAPGTTDLTPSLAEVIVHLTGWQRVYVPFARRGKVPLQQNLHPNTRDERR